MKKDIIKRTLEIGIIVLSIVILFSALYSFTYYKIYEYPMYKSFCEENNGYMNNYPICLIREDNNYIKYEIQEINGEFEFVR